MKCETIAIEHLSFAEVMDYVKSNCKMMSTMIYGAFWEVKTPLKVWKQTNYRGMVIVALEIPVGATIYMPSKDAYPIQYRRHIKMRASEANVIRQFRCAVVSNSLCGDVRHYGLHHYEEILTSFSNWDNSFNYDTGTTVKPEKFSMKCDSCVPGIHFFVNLTDALEY